jgi:hypothetical protein
MSVKKQVTLPDELVAKAKERAHSLGMNLDEYVQSLVMDDVESLVDPWRQPLPWEVEKRLLLEEIEFYEQEKTTPQKAAHSAQELMQLLDEEIQQVNSDEAD